MLPHKQGVVGILRVRALPGDVKCPWLPLSFAGPCIPNSRYLGVDGVAIEVLYGRSIYYLGTQTLRVICLGTSDSDAL